jgi:hypothetical protein
LSSIYHCIGDALPDQTECPDYFSPSINGSDVRLQQFHHASVMVDPQALNSSLPNTRIGASSASSSAS